ncbi:MAG: Rieske (2Fe-2S) protein [Polyangiales bacterium]
MDEGRRRALTVIACGAGAAGAGAVAVPAAGMVIGAAEAGGPGRAATGDGWTALGRLDELPDGTPVQRPIVGSEGDAWTVAPQRRLGAVFVLREGASVRGWSSICPHVGCLVEWSDARYVCRCHDSAFARDGAVTSGISPRGLDPLETRVVDGVVSIRFVRYRLGVAQREAIG